MRGGGREWMGWAAGRVNTGDAVANCSRHYCILVRAYWKRHFLKLQKGGYLSPVKMLSIVFFSFFFFFFFFFLVFQFASRDIPFHKFHSTDSCQFAKFSSSKF